MQINQEVAGKSGPQQLEALCSFLTGIQDWWWWLSLFPCRNQTVRRACSYRTASGRLAWREERFMAPAEWQLSVSVALHKFGAVGCQRGNGVDGPWCSSWLGAQTAVTSVHVNMVLGRPSFLTILVHPQCFSCDWGPSLLLQSDLIASKQGVCHL
jgi:hypothetical protein